MALNPDDPTIPANCADAVLPAGLTQDLTCVEYTLRKGPIVNLYRAKPGNPFAALPTALEITRRLALPDSDAEQLVGPLIVQVSRTPPTGNTIRVNGRDIDESATSPYQVTVQHLTAPVEALSRQTQAGRVSGHWYGVDANDTWHGGQNGLGGGSATLKLRKNIPTGENDLQTLTGTLTGAGKYDDPVMASPVPAVFGD